MLLETLFQQILKDDIVFDILAILLFVLKPIFALFSLFVWFKQKLVDVPENYYKDEND